MSDSGSHSSVHSRGLTTRRGHWLLLCGAAAGITVAATDVLRKSVPALPTKPEIAEPRKMFEPLPVDVVARVNGRVIRTRDFEDVLTREIAGGMVPSDDNKRRLLDGMIDEELRVQHAIDLKLHLTDARVRADLASAITAAVIAVTEDKATDANILRSFYNERREYFAQRGLVHVRQIWVGVVAGNLGEAYFRARDAAELLRKGVEFEAVKDIYGSHDPLPIPNKLLEPKDLETFVGGAALDTVLTQLPGKICDPVRAADGFRVLKVMQRRANPAPSFENSRLQVEAEYRRDSIRRALEANAKDLRKTADIQQTKSP